MRLNPVTMIDGYKLDHRRQFPDGLTHMQSNFTPRASRVAGSEYVVTAGLQFAFTEYLTHQMKDKFFYSGRGKDETLTRFKRRLDSYVPGNNIGTEHIGDLFDLGYVPLKINALPEGTLCPLRVPMFTVENTHEKFAWVVNFFETLLSSTIWGPCTSATTAYRYRKLLDAASERTGYDPSFVPWQAHDFSFRGMWGPQAACMSALGHLFSFYGTDTLPVLDFIEDYYGGYAYHVESNKYDFVIGGTIPATEHSVMCAGGQEEEIETFRRLLNLYPSGPFSVVSDTWNLWDVLTKFLPELKPEIMARDGKLVIRPDSGDPVDIICGDSLSSGINQGKGAVELLWDVFGGHKTDKGFKQLDPHVGLIYGDSITYERAKEIIQRLEAKGFCPDVVLGIGSYTYQYVTRDTYGFAMKATWAKINGEERNLFKKPVTDDGVKNSATGRLAVDKDFNLIQCASPEEEALSLLTPVWENGSLLRRDTLNTIRTRLHPNWKL